MNEWYELKMTPVTMHKHPMMSEKGLYILYVWMRLITLPPSLLFDNSSQDKLSPVKERQIERGR